MGLNRWTKERLFFIFQSISYKKTKEEEEFEGPQYLPDEDQPPMILPSTFGMIGDGQPEPGTVPEDMVRLKRKGDRVERFFLVSKFKRRRGRSEEKRRVGKSWNQGKEGNLARTC